MSFCYLPSLSSWFRQGEIIGDLFELRPKVTEGDTIDVKQATEVERIDHPYAIVVSQDCDLEWDYKARQGQASDDKFLTHILFCCLYFPDEIRGRPGLDSSQLFKRARQNQNERYHHFDQAPTDDTEQVLPEFYADFKTTFSLPVGFAYTLLSGGYATRLGFLSSPHLQDFMHKLCNFLGRVAIP